MKKDCYGLVFGVNMFIALSLQTILQAIIQRYKVPVIHQFYIYSGYFFLLGVAFSIVGGYSVGHIGWKRGWRFSKYMYAERFSANQSVSTIKNNESAVGDVITRS